LISQSRGLGDVYKRQLENLIAANFKERLYFLKMLI
jgi:hypothetical protein